MALQGVTHTTTGGKYMRRTTAVMFAAAAMVSTGLVVAAPASAAAPTKTITCVNDADGDGYTITIGKKSHHYETGSC